MSNKKTFKTQSAIFPVSDDDLSVDEARDFLMHGPAGPMSDEELDEILKIVELLLKKK